MSELNQIEFLQIEPTTRCNFTCGFCCGRSMIQQDITPTLFKKALQQFPNLKHIELQGEGEPLLHPEFFSMARKAKERGIKISIITNGSLLSKRDTVNHILDIGFEKVAISIESATPEKFTAVRGGKLQNVIAGITALIKERKTRSLSRPVVGFAVTVLESTVNDYPAIVDLYQQLEMDGGITTQLLQRMETYVKVYGVATQAEIVSEKSALLSLEHKATAKKRIGSVPQVGFYPELFSATNCNTNCCAWLEKGVFITADGTMSPCPKIKDASTFGYGNLEDDLYTINKVRNEMRTQLKRGKIPRPCTGCPDAEKFRGRPDTTLSDR